MLLVRTAVPGPLVVSGLRAGVEHLSLSAAVNSLQETRGVLFMQYLDDEVGVALWGCWSLLL